MSNASLDQNEFQDADENLDIEDQELAETILDDSPVIEETDNNQDQNEQQIQKPIVEAEIQNETKSKFQFHSNIVLFTPDEEVKAQQDRRIAEMNFSQHEFLKMNQVGSLINEAVQSVLDKINMKDKLAQATKTAIRLHDNKLKQLEQNVYGLLKLSQQVRDCYKKVKDLKVDFDIEHAAKIEQYTKIEFQFIDVTNKVAQVTTDKNMLYDRVAALEKRSDENYDLTQNKIDKIKLSLLKIEEDFKIEFKKSDNKVHESKQQQIKLLDNFNTLADHCKKITKFECEKIVETLKQDSQRLIMMEQKVKKLDSMQMKVDSMDGSIKQLIVNLNDTQENQVFNERALPLLIHLQLAEGMSQLIQTETQLTLFQQFDKMKLSQIHTYVSEADGFPVRLSMLRQRIQAYAKYLVEQNCGSLPFRFGIYQDYWHGISENDIKYFNKAKEFQKLQSLMTNLVSDARELTFNEIKRVVDNNQIKQNQKKEVNRGIKEKERQLQQIQLAKQQKELTEMKKLTKKERDFQPQQEIQQFVQIPVAPPQVVENNTTKVVLVQKIDEKRLERIARAMRSFMKMVKQTLENFSEATEERFIQLKRNTDCQQIQLIAMQDFIKEIVKFISDPDSNPQSLIKKIKELEDLVTVTIAQEQTRAAELVRSVSNIQQTPIFQSQKKQRYRKGEPEHLPPPDYTELITAQIQTQMQPILEQIQESKKSIEYNEKKLATVSANLSDATELFILKIDNQIQQGLETQKVKIDAAIKIVQSESAQTQQILINRQKQVEQQLEQNNSLMAQTIEQCDDLKQLFKRDYIEFVRDRRRWKSDFENANLNTKKFTHHIEELFKIADNSIQYNTKAIKMLLDVVMITQLMERQEVEDKKQIGLFGMRTQKEILNPYLIQESNKSQVSQTAIDFGEAPISETDDEVSQLFSGHVNKECQVLKVDRQCLQCSGNLGQVIHQLKLACLTYTQSQVPYKDKLFNVTDMLRIKGGIISECQRIVRDFIHNSTTYDGADQIQFKDERSYIIEPLLGLSHTKKKEKPKQQVTKVEVGIDKMMHKNRQSRETSPQNRPRSQLLNEMLPKATKNVIQFPDFISGFGNNEIFQHSTMGSEVYPSEMRGLQRRASNPFQAFDPLINSQNAIHLKPRPSTMMGAHQKAASSSEHKNGSVILKQHLFASQIESKKSHGMTIQSNRKIVTSQATRNQQKRTIVTTNLSETQKFNLGQTLNNSEIIEPIELKIKSLQPKQNQNN